VPAALDVPAVLARHGVVPGPGGFAWADLAALAEGRGWHVGAEALPRPTLWTRYRAIVWRPVDPRDAAPRTRTARGRGMTGEAALAAALAAALLRWERRPAA
jgi:hypothetical protein